MSRLTRAMLADEPLANPTAGRLAVSRLAPPLTMLPPPSTPATTRALTARGAAAVLPAPPARPRSLLSGHSRRRQSVAWRVQHVAVRVRPVEAAPDAPEVDDVADQIDRVGIDLGQEVEQRRGLRPARAEVDVRQEQGSVVFRHLAHAPVAVAQRGPRLMSIIRSNRYCHRVTLRYRGCRVHIRSAAPRPTASCTTMVTARQKTR